MSFGRAEVLVANFISAVRAQAAGWADKIVKLSTTGYPLERTYQEVHTVILPRTSQVMMMAGGEDCEG